MGRAVSAPTERINSVQSGPRGGCGCGAGTIKLVEEEEVEVIEELVEVEVDDEEGEV
jgi:hypothetical protein